MGTKQPRPDFLLPLWPRDRAQRTALQELKLARYWAKDNMCSVAGRAVDKAMGALVMADMAEHVDGQPDGLRWRRAVAAARKAVKDCEARRLRPRF